MPAAAKLANEAATRRAGRDLGPIALAQATCLGPTKRRGLLRALKPKSCQRITRFTMSEAPESPICTAHLADERDDFRGALDSPARLAVGLELKETKRHRGKRRIDLFRLRIDEQADDGHEGGQRGDDRARLIERDLARRPGPEYEANGIRTRVRSGDAVLDARDAADLEARLRCAWLQH